MDTLLTSWFDKVRRPSRTIYVLDTSGSMAEGGRIEALRGALAGLAGADDSLVGRFRRFRGREQVTLLSFNTTPAAPITYTVPQDDPAPVLAQITAAGNALQPAGGTAIYDSLIEADRVAEQQLAADPDRFTSIVLMTDGENTSGGDPRGVPRPRRRAPARAARRAGVPGAVRRGRQHRDDGGRAAHRWPDLRRPLRIAGRCVHRDPGLCLTALCPTARGGPGSDAG